MLFVPGGEFIMASSGNDPKAGADEKPQRKILLDANWIDKTEITNDQFARFLNTLGDCAGACGGHDCVETQLEDKLSHLLYQDGGFLAEPGFEDHPVTQVTWYGAQAYCTWTGTRLPTEA